MSTEGRRGCRRCEVRAHRAALARKRAVVALLVLAAAGVLVTGLWAAGTTEDARIGWAGVLLAAGCLFLASEMEAGR